MRHQAVECPRPGNSGQLDCRHFVTAKLDQEIKVTPGQRVSAISNDAGTLSLSVTELNDKIDGGNQQNPGRNSQDKANCRVLTGPMKAI